MSESLQSETMVMIILPPTILMAPDQLWKIGLGLRPRDLWA
ncbi:hypothetical protein VD0002_g9522 [Verticillium dahliae]|uniref:Uncharacterized protein n=1 Tax=Verticillium dahliae TaxID=27337 RepID=A0A2J8E905_VERDA|nr:hypothetical protein BJF96_g8906 [Verticillium dahliae]PNH36940.1 hypothetical protein VD0004_g9829 [Verticillium dahliae]PNH47519.1 hypothetical protein VD0003_g8791 [Verticillium dahliae]PNH57999.1 hypothetical protein VD0002_g9522 [Verticillium dahliae]PNH61799.1 hypothetical protein VD0001_g9620 [Verticillium dahliae]